MYKINKKNWIIIFASISLILLVSIATFVIICDPFFHFHKPLTDIFSYKFDNQRYQNDGITKNFDYTGMITGTSMTENFMKTEADKIFDRNFIKVPYSGGTFKEVNNNMLIAVRYNKKIDIIIRGLDCNYFFEDPNLMRRDLKEYPFYLYDDILINDVKYVYNIDVIKLCLNSIYKSFIKKQTGFENDFDSYSYWMYDYEFGKNAVMKKRKKYIIATQSIPQKISDEEYKMLDENINKNVLSIVVGNPNISFYYFFPPFSAAWWGKLKENGTLHKYIMAEKLVIEKLIGQKNLHLYSFDNFYDITTDLNNYRDEQHYGEWINSKILVYLKTGTGRLTKENYKSYLKDIEEFYSNFDYNELFDQIDDIDKIPKLSRER